MTIVIVVGQVVLFGYRSPATHLVLETVDASIALLVAYLFYGRFRRSHRWQDFLLLQGLALFAVAGLGLTVVLRLTQAGRTGVLDVWLPLGLRVSGAGCLVAAAVLPRHLVMARKARLWMVGTTLAGVAIFFAVLGAVQDRLPLALDPALSPESAVRPVIVGHPTLVAAQFVITACFALACVAFTRQAQHHADELLVWLGPACALAAFARLNYVLYPSIYSDWVYSGDFLRTGFYLLLLVGAAREIGQYWAAREHEAVAEDRRRLARELHDGVLQELAYIRSVCFGLRAVDPDRAGRIIAACDEPLGYLLHQAARQVSERQAVVLEIDIDDSVAATPTQRHALVRIAREAVSNAARHGRAPRVSVRLSAHGLGGCLEVHDDGVGFDPDVTRSHVGSGYGLTSMRERAAALPGRLDLGSAPGRGTKVTVVW